MNFADLVKARRIELGMTQLDLAYALQITPSTISMWERGRMLPHYKSLAKLSNVLGVSERDLLFPPDVVDVAEKNEDNKNVQ